MEVLEVVVPVVLGIGLESHVTKHLARRKGEEIMIIDDFIFFPRPCLSRVFGNQPDLLPCVLVRLDAEHTLYSHFLLQGVDILYFPRL